MATELVGGEGQDWVSPRPMKERLPLIRSARRRKHGGLHLMDRFEAQIDRAVAKVTGVEPASEPGPENRTIKIFPRYGAPETGRWVELPDGEMTVLRSSDIVHEYQGTQLVERKRVADNPTGFHVFPEGRPYER